LDSIRFTQRETATGIFFLSAIAIWGTLHGFGPFVGKRKTSRFSLCSPDGCAYHYDGTFRRHERGRAEEALESEKRKPAANAATSVCRFEPRDTNPVTEKWRKLFGLRNRTSEF
jgi:hypothetical protein